MAEATDRTNNPEKSKEGRNFQIEPLVENFALLMLLYPNEKPSILHAIMCAANYNTKNTMEMINYIQGERKKINKEQKHLSLSDFCSTLSNTKSVKKYITKYLKKQNSASASRNSERNVGKNQSADKNSNGVEVQDQNTPENKSNGAVKKDDPKRKKPLNNADETKIKKQKLEHIDLTENDINQQYMNNSTASGANDIIEDDEIIVLSVSDSNDLSLIMQEDQQIFENNDTKYQQKEIENTFDLKQKYVINNENEITNKNPRRSKRMNAGKRGKENIASEFDPTQIKKRMLPYTKKQKKIENNRTYQHEQDEEINKKLGRTDPIQYSVKSTDDKKLRMRLKVHSLKEKAGKYKQLKNNTETEDNGAVPENEKFPESEEIPKTEEILRSEEISNTEEILEIDNININDGNKSNYAVCPDSACLTTPAAYTFECKYENNDRTAFLTLKTPNN